MTFINTLNLDSSYGYLSKNKSFIKPMFTQFRY